MVEDAQGRHHGIISLSSLCEWVSHSREALLPQMSHPAMLYSGGLKTILYSITLNSIKPFQIVFLRRYKRDSAVCVESHFFVKRKCDGWRRITGIFISVTPVSSFEPSLQRN